MLSSSFFIIILIDFLLGDPYWLPHPVRWIGRLISATERKLYPDNGSCTRKGLAGTVTCVFVVLVVSGVGCLFLFLCKQISDEVCLAGEIIIGFYCLSVRSLVIESLIVRKYLLNNDIERARYAVSRIVGRDSANLNSEQVSRATVETIAENIVDGIISPLFFLILGGPIAALAFKAVSTMDSMIGYKNDRYMNFGRCAARLDDILNFVPARITAFFVIPMAALIMKKNMIGALRCAFRDRLKHPSPNSAHGESSVAGALGVRLGGESSYNGKVVCKPVINPDGRSVDEKDILSTVNLVYGSILIVSITVFVFVVWKHKLF